MQRKERRRCLACIMQSKQSSSVLTQFQYYKRKKDCSMKKVSRFLLSTLLLICLLSTSVFAAYSPSKAINYSNKYALSENALTTLNTGGYNVYPNNDCTNYVSQCIYAGGLPQDSQWKSTLSHGGRVPHRTDSKKWTVANELKNYLKSSGRSTKIGSWSLRGSPEPYRTFAYANNSNNLTSSNVGKVVLFYDWTGDGHMDHSAFFVRNNSTSTYTPPGTTRSEGTGDLINHNHKHVLWRPDKRDIAQKETTRVYGFELNT